MILQEEDKDQDDDVQLLSVCAVSRPSVDLQQLGCVHYNVDGVILYAEISRCALGRWNDTGSMKQKKLQVVHSGSIIIRIHYLSFIMGSIITTQQSS